VREGKREKSRKNPIPGVLCGMSIVGNFKTCRNLPSDPGYEKNSVKKNRKLKIGKIGDSEW
jgi:hypothetical protein